LPADNAKPFADLPVMLAPMAGITDLPFRNLVQRFGAGMVVSEMIASRDIVTARAGTRQRAGLGLERAGTAVQLAGRDPFWMAEAARLVEAQGAQVIDINMGCPAKKVTGGQSGSALMRDLGLALSLIRAVVGAVTVPVTLKCRLGWDDACLNAPELARMAEAEGISRIAVHGRTRCQFYKGQSDWAAIGCVVNSVRIPVIANGDIDGLASARRALAASGAAGVMVGRAARGRPWLLAKIAAGLAGRAYQGRPRGAVLTGMALAHYQDMLDFYGVETGARAARKHLGWYMDGAGTPPMLRREVLTASDPARVSALLATALQSGQSELAA